MNSLLLTRNINEIRGSIKKIHSPPQQKKQKSGSKFQEKEEGDEVEVKETSPPTQLFFNDIKNLLSSQNEDENKLDKMLELQNIFKIHHDRLVTSKLSLWYKKYEQELKLRLEMEKKVKKLQSAYEYSRKSINHWTQNFESLSSLQRLQQLGLEIDDPAKNSEENDNLELEEGSYPDMKEVEGEEAVEESENEDDDDASVKQESLENMNCSTSEKEKEEKSNSPHETKEIQDTQTQSVKNSNDKDQAPTESEAQNSPSKTIKLTDINLPSLENLQMLEKSTLNSNFLDRMSQNTHPHQLKIKDETCMLCRESLHPINLKFEELEKENKILRNTISKMERQGMELMKNTKFYRKENKSLKKMNENLSDLIKKSTMNMEIMMAERISMRKDWEQIIEKKEQEIARLRLKIQNIAQDRLEQSQSESMVIDNQKFDSFKVVEESELFKRVDSTLNDRDSSLDFSQPLSQIRENKLKHDEENKLYTSETTNFTNSVSNVASDLNSTLNTSAYESLKTTNKSEFDESKSRNSALYEQEKKLYNLKRYLKKNKQTLSSKQKKKVQGEIERMEAQIKKSNAREKTKQYQRDSIEKSTIRQSLKGLQGNRRKQRLKYGGMGNMEQFDDGHVNREYCSLI